jgi:hypothetical protein
VLDETPADYSAKARRARCQLTNCSTSALAFIATSVNRQWEKALFYDAEGEQSTEFRVQSSGSSASNRVHIEEE